LDTNHPQTNHFWPSSQVIPKSIKVQGLFRDLSSVSSFTVEVSSPRKPPFVFTYSLSLFNLLLTATVPSSCHPGRLCLASSLLSILIITKLFYQISHIHLGLLQIFIGLVHQPLSSFRSVFFSCFVKALPFFALRRPRVKR